MNTNETAKSGTATTEERAPWELAADPATAPEVLRTLADNADWLVVFAVARNWHTPADVLERLATWDRCLHEAVANNPAASLPATPKPVRLVR